MARRDLSGKRILLTGASSGLGEALARALAKHQPKLLLTARREQSLSTLSTDLKSQGCDSHFIAGDLTEPQTRSKLVAFCQQQFGGIDILINNAGVGAMGDFETASPERLRKIFEVNFFSSVDLVRSTLKDLKGGNDSLIVNVGSVLGHRAAPLKSEYCASKFAIHGFSDSLRCELAGQNVELLHVCPSTIDTDFFDAAVEDSTGKDWKSNMAMQPEYVASRVVSAMQRRKHELILPTSAKLLVWLDRLLPSLANRIVARFGR